MNRRTFLGMGGAALAAPLLPAISHAGTVSTQETQNHIVRITQFRFVPQSLSVKLGDRVTWVNDDIVPHTASAEDDSWDSGELGATEAGEILITEASAGPYFCRFHPSMRARLDLDTTG